MFYTISCTWSSFNYLYVYFPIQFGQACSWLSGMVHDCQLLGPFTQVCRGYKYNFQVHRFVSYYFIIWSKWCIYFCIFVRNCKMNWQDPWSWSIETTFAVAVTAHRSSWSTRSSILWTVDRPQSFPIQFRPSYSDDKIHQSYRIYTAFPVYFLLAAVDHLPVQSSLDCVQVIRTILQRNGACFCSRKRRRSLSAGVFGEPHSVVCQAIWRMEAFSRTLWLPRWRASSSTSLTFASSYWRELMKEN